MHFIVYMGLKEIFNYGATALVVSYLSISPANAKDPAELLKELFNSRPEREDYTVKDSDLGAEVNDAFKFKQNIQRICDDPDGYMGKFKDAYIVVNSEDGRPHKTLKRSCCDTPTTGFTPVFPDKNMAKNIAGMLGERNGVPYIIVKFDYTAVRRMCSVPTS